MLFTVLSTPTSRKRGSKPPTRYHRSKSRRHSEVFIDTLDPILTHGPGAGTTAIQKKVA
jgi:hypothetical protein